MASRCQPNGTAVSVFYNPEALNETSQNELLFGCKGPNTSKSTFRCRIKYYKYYIAQKVSLMIN